MPKVIMVVADSLECGLYLSSVVVTITLLFKAYQMTQACLGESCIAHNTLMCYYFPRRTLRLLFALPFGLTGDLEMSSSETGHAAFASGAY